jgi:hypothetical protein
MWYIITIKHQHSTLNSITLSLSFVIMKLLSSVYVFVFLLILPLSLSAMAPRGLVPFRHMSCAFIGMDGREKKLKSVANSVANVSSGGDSPLNVKSFLLLGLQVLQDWLGWAIVVAPMLAVIYSPMLSGLFQGLNPNNTSMMKIGVALSVTSMLIFVNGKKNSSKVLLSDAAEAGERAAKLATEAGERAAKLATEAGERAAKLATEAGERAAKLAFETCERVANNLILGVLCVVVASLLREKNVKQIN